MSSKSGVWPLSSDVIDNGSGEAMGARPSRINRWYPREEMNRLGYILVIRTLSSPDVAVDEGVGANVAGVVDIGFINLVEGFWLDSFNRIVGSNVMTVSTVWLVSSTRLVSKIGSSEQLDFSVIDIDVWISCVGSLRCFIRVIARLNCAVNFCFGWCKIDDKCVDVFCSMSSFLSESFGDNGFGSRIAVGMSNMFLLIVFSRFIFPRLRPTRAARRRQEKMLRFLLFPKKKKRKIIQNQISMQKKNEKKTIYFSQQHILTSHGIFNRLVFACFYLMNFERKNLVNKWNKSQYKPGFFFIDWTL